VLFSVVFAWLLLGQLPALVQLVGAVILLGGVIVVRAGETPAAA
jgi:drug/metabolite transporter (DMT)-like permease